MMLDWSANWGTCRVGLSTSRLFPIYKSMGAHIYRILMPLRGANTRGKSQEKTLP